MQKNEEFLEPGGSSAILISLKTNTHRKKEGNSKKG